MLGDLQYSSVPEEQDLDYSWLRQQQWSAVVGFGRSYSSACQATDNYRDIFTLFVQKITNLNVLCSFLAKPFDLH